jgi:predicted nucleic acid-binding Zn ribbon protein
MPMTLLEKESARSALAQPGGLVVAPPDAFRPCPVCGRAMTGRRTAACSGACRAVKSRRRRGEALAADVAAVQAALAKILTRWSHPP